VTFGEEVLSKDQIESLRKVNPILLSKILSIKSFEELLTSLHRILNSEGPIPASILLKIFIRKETFMKLENASNYGHKVPLHLNSFMRKFRGTSNAADVIYGPLEDMPLFMEHPHHILKGIAIFRLEVCI
jgi:hypothetical protein